MPIPVLLTVRELGIGGCERDLAKLAKAIDRTQFEPHVGCFHSEGLRTAELRAAGVPIVEFPVRSFKDFSGIAGARKLGCYVKEHRIQVVHSFDVPTVVFATPAARFYKVPAVISAQLGIRELFPTFYQRVLRFTDRLADVVVANSAELQRYLIEDEKVPANRTYLCYNGVETDVFHPANEPRPKVVTGAPLVIGAVCALRKEKRLDLLLKAFAKVKHLMSGMKLLIVGSGPLLAELEPLRDTLGLQADCVFEPAKTDVATWMRAIDIFVMCSETESFPNALLEAMASGCTPVGSRVGGVPELISDGESGLLFESQNVEDLVNALGRLIKDDSLRRRLGKAAATSAREKFSMEINARRNEALYRSVLQRKGYWPNGSA